MKITSADGCQLNVNQWGRGHEPLLLIHGFGENGYSWGELPAQILSAYSVLAVDLRGHGDSQWDAGTDYRHDKLVADIASVLDELRIGSFCMAGHSLGATIAARIAASRPQSVRKLVLVELNIDPTPDEALEFLLAQFDAQFQVYRSVSDYYEYLQSQRPVANPTALLRFAQYSLRPCANGSGFEVKSDPQLRRLQTDLRAADLFRRKRLDISRVVCPMLLVRGSGSAFLSRAAAQQTVALAPKGQLAVVEGAGHSVMMDQPAEFTAILTRFLTATPG